MPRTARKRSMSGYMHVIVRGIGKQILFEEQNDYQFFLSRLKRYSKETSVSIVAYCLMENHVHLLVRDNNGNTPAMMKKIGVSYSSYFNNKYERTGHLFQDRYLCEAVETDRAVLTVARYILNNPAKAGLGRVSSYRWSSYSCYGRTDSFVDTGILCDLIGSREQYDSYLTEENEDNCMEYEKPRHDDEWAKRIIHETLMTSNGMEIQGYDKKRRDDALRELKSKGLSIRQLERLTGINRGVILRV